MKSILISIKPKYVADILNGKKTIEIRKTMPKCDLPIDVYIYCMKDNKQRLYPVALLDKSNQVFKRAYREDKIDNRTNYLNGKVVAKFTLNKVDEHHVLPTERILPFNWNVEQKLKQLCLTKEEVMAYGNGEDYQAFLWHISNLAIFDKPKELSEFNYWNVVKNNEYFYGEFPLKTPLTKAPQSWCYVEVE